MVHKYSKRALAARRDRAVRKGYIVPIKGKRWAETDSKIYSRGSHVARSMDSHHRHNAVLDSPFTIGSLLARSACKRDSTDEYTETMDAREIANLPEHSWPALPVSSGEKKKRSRSSWADLVDELPCCDERTDDL
eukprot:8337871-Karenia_brevis.AAC.1